MKDDKCPLCFGPASACAPFLVKNMTLQPRIACKAYAPEASQANLERAVKFSGKSLASSSKTSPSTNRPIVCPACHPELAEDAHKPENSGAPKKRKGMVRPAVWSYNMRAHWQRLHSTTPMFRGIAAAIELAPNERDRLKKS